MEPVNHGRAYLQTWRSPWGPMSFASMAASSRINRRHVVHLSKISFWPFFRLTFPWSDPYALSMIVNCQTNVNISSFNMVDNAMLTRRQLFCCLLEIWTFLATILDSEILREPKARFFHWLAKKLLDFWLFVVVNFIFLILPCLLSCLKAFNFNSCSCNS